MALKSGVSVHTWTPHCQKVKGSVPHDPHKIAATGAQCPINWDPFASQSYCYTVWSAIGIILWSVCPSVRPSVRPSVCDVVNCGSHGWCTGLNVVPACSAHGVPVYMIYVVCIICLCLSASCMRSFLSASRWLNPAPLQTVLPYLTKKLVSIFRHKAFQIKFKLSGLVYKKVRCSWSFISCTQHQHQHP